MTRADPLARAVFALLVFACFAAFFVTQRLKHTPTAVQNFKLTPRFSPTSAGEAGEERISFKLAQADEVTVTILDSAGDTTATLVRDWPVARYKQFSLRWNGRVGAAHRYTLVHTAGRSSGSGVTSVRPNNRGRLASAGEYRVWVSLRRLHRSVRSPRSFTLVR
ncbi:MAG TPA: hypothetical protein VES65_06395 [Solirubrobacteraceae bacterium]|nr:hypothetical protein [Solirubrobacteraceae bacterium]